MANRIEFSGRVVFNEKANQGLGAHVALMVPVADGHEVEAASIKSAFAHGAADTRERSGVPLTEKQISQRIDQLEAAKGQERSIEELQRAREAIRRAKTLGASA